MNKKIIVVAMLGVFMFSGVAFAQSQQAVLPSAGLTPESNFYFLDKFSEALREFFTFNPEGKAHLQITFAAERIAEIKVILETKGVEAKGLEVAQGRLQAHLANAATIVVDQKAKGKDVSQFAKELDDEFDAPKTALEQAFKAEKRTLEVQEKELKGKIIEARRAGDTAQVEKLVQQLGQIKAQKELLELKEEEAEEALEQEEERIEEEMEVKEEAEKAIREAEKEKQEVLDEVAEEDIAVPAEAFGKFDSLLAQAKSALVASNYPEAKRLAKQAEKNLDVVDDAIEDLEEAKEEAEELKEEQEEKEQEAKEEQDEKVKEEAEKDAERLEKEREKAEEATQKAEEQLLDAGDEEESD
ncbi:MAG: DUF5667 domain-containing protein [Candidatus Paceibacterota bacterium]